jgi:PIN domain nuclease of toxin-antitoxin system
VRLLIDTHALFWWLTDNRRLSGAAGAAIDDPKNDLLVSAVVGYELAYKQASGRISRLPDSLPRQLQRAGIMVLPLSLNHALAAAALPGPHRDPWDRIMMAQAFAEGLAVITIDPRFSEYGVPVIW